MLNFPAVMLTVGRCGSRLLLRGPSTTADLRSFAATAPAPVRNKAVWFAESHRTLDAVTQQNCVSFLGLVQVYSLGMFKIIRIWYCYIILLCGSGGAMLTKWLQSSGGASVQALHNKYPWATNWNCVSWGVQGTMLPSCTCFTFF